MSEESLLKRAMTYQVVLILLVVLLSFYGLVADKLNGDQWVNIGWAAFATIVGRDFVERFRVVQKEPKS